MTHIQYGHVVRDFDVYDMCAGLKFSSSSAQVQGSSLRFTAGIPSFSHYLTGDFELGDLALSIGLCGSFAVARCQRPASGQEPTSIDLLGLRRKHIASYHHQVDQDSLFV